MQHPRAAQLSEPLREAVVVVARALAGAGHRCWMVGGVVRDLARGVPGSDVDLCSAARPEEVERLFPRAVGVGRRFGTVVIPVGGCGLEHTTFRTEGEYRDGRRPDRLDFGTSLVEDALRRDFTVNAMYLDPLTDDLEDPTGGFADLGRGLLRAVGDPLERFREDGLRLLRLARFAGRFGFEVEERTLSGAVASAGSLCNLSPERILAEWERMSADPGLARSLDVLSRAGLLPGALPGLPALGEQEWRDRLAVARRLVRGAPPGPALLLAVLYDPGPPWRPEAVHGALSALGALKPSRALLREVGRLWGALSALVPTPGEVPWMARARRWAALEVGEASLALALARSGERGEPSGREVEALAELAAGVPPKARSPEPLLTAEDLLARGWVPGPILGRLLAELARRQRGGDVSTREQAIDFSEQWRGRDLE